MKVMDEIKPLLRTPRPYPDESLKGLLVRATEENGYHTSSLLLYLANVGLDAKGKRILYREMGLKNLSKMLNIDIPTLQDMACLSGIKEILPQAYNMFGHKIHKYSVRAGNPKTCPGCLRESNYIRKIWDLAAFTCCPKHKTLLIEKCPKCGLKISWKRDKVSVCECGQDWKKVDLPEVSEAETILSRLILKVCGLWESDEAAVERKDGENPAGNPLSTVGLSELLCAAYFIAGQQHGVVDATGKQYAVKLPQEELHDVLTKAVAVFEKWPDNFFKFLDECKGKNYTGERHSGLYKDFGKLYDPLFIRKGNPLPDFMREAFKKYITTVWDGGYAGWCGSLSDEELKKKTYMTRYEVTKYLQVSLMTVNRLYKKSYLDGLYLPWVNRSRIMIEADSVRELKERWDKSITAAEAGDMLGIGRRAVVSLVKSTCLAAIQGPIVTGQIEWKFETPEVEKLLQCVLGKIPEGKTETPTGGVSFHKSIQKLSKLSLDVGAFVKMILDGKITPRANGDGTGLSSLLFNAFEIKQFSMAEAVERRSGKRTMQEAVKLLHTGYDIIIFLIERGFLAAERTGSSRSSWAIPQEEINRFKNTYCTVGRIARALGTSSREISWRLMDNGIMPVTGPKVDGGKNYFFKKADLEAVDFSAILLPKIKKSVMQEMNEKGLVSVKQLADTVGCSRSLITRFVRSGKIVPADKRLGVGKGNRLFYSQDQIKKLRELIAEEKRRLLSLYERQLGMPLAA